MEPNIIIALDGFNLEQCLTLISKIGDKAYAFKIHNLWDEHGPGIVGEFKSEGAKRVWVDLKIDDIPNTGSLRASAVKKSGADILTVMTSGGIEMMAAAVASGPAEIFGVTILTSLSEEETHLLFGQPTKAAVIYRARLAKLAGAQGIVCSAKEVGLLAKLPELKGMKFIVPGVRSVGQDVGDQKRVDTPKAALVAGATHLVIGRQITGAEDPVQAFEELMGEVTQ